MPVKAKIHSQYLWRLKLMTLGCLGMALWFAYDGTITYPRQRHRALTYERLKDEERLEDWPEVAGKNQWPLEFPGKPKTEVEIYAQLVLGAVVAVPGLIFGFIFLRVRRRWIEMHETGLRSSWGQQLEFDQIESLNKRQWKSKGIARIRYLQNDRKRRFVLDDWKYDADPTLAMLQEVESRLELEQITGGPPEPPPGEEDETAEPPVDDDATDEPPSENGPEDEADAGLK